MENFDDFTAENLNQEFAKELGPGEEFDEEEIEEIKSEGELPERPSFPLITFIFAVFLDIGKLFSMGFLGIITGIMGLFLVRIYLIGKISFIRRYAWKKATTAALKNTIPFLGSFLGSWSYFILRAHSKNYKRIDQILEFFEKGITKGKSL